MEETRVASSKPRALIVDDERDMLDYMERVLRRHFRVTVTSQPEEALEYLRSGEFELFLTDHQMPRVNGLELLAQVEDLDPSMVRIVISGFAEAPEIQAAVETGMIHNYILKPVGAMNLLSAIERAYENRDRLSAQKSD